MNHKEYKDKIEEMMMKADVIKINGNDHCASMNFYKYDSSGFLTLIYVLSSSIPFSVYINISWS